VELSAMIQMDPQEARQQLREYRSQLHNRADAEYRAVAQGLEALAEGRPVLHLTNAIAGAGLTPGGYPRLAVGRADRRVIQGRWQGRSFFDFDARKNPSRWNGVRSETLIQRIDMGVDHPNGADTAWSLVPMVPPQGVRKAGGFAALGRHFILWEVEQWYARLPSAKADVDPYLLRHLGGDLYAVVHEWDLTELERAVMTARANS
jgi:hypothetical protein